MAEALYVGLPDEEQVTVPAGGYSPGEIVQAPSGRAGFVLGQRALEEGEPAILKTSGKVSVDSASATTFTAGDEIEWDDTGKVAVAAAGGDFDIGRASKDKANGEVKVEVLLNEVNGT